MQNKFYGDPRRVTAHQEASVLPSTDRNPLGKGRTKVELGDRSTWKIPAIVLFPKALTFSPQIGPPWGGDNHRPLLEGRCLSQKIWPLGSCDLALWGLGSLSESEEVCHLCSVQALCPFRGGANGGRESDAWTVKEVASAAQVLRACRGLRIEAHGWHSPASLGRCAHTTPSLSLDLEFRATGWPGCVEEWLCGATTGPGEEVRSPWLKGLQQ